MVALRSVFAAIILFAVLIIRRHRFAADRQRWFIGIVAGIFQLSLPFIFFSLAYQRASAGFVGMLVALIPIGTSIVAHFMLPDEPLSIAKATGLSVAFAGVALLLLGGSSGLEEGGEPLIAGLLILGAVSSISFGTVFIRGRAGKFDTTEISFMQFLVGIVVVGVIMLQVEGLPAHISTWGWTMIAYMTVMGTIVPTMLFYWLLQRVSSTKASLVGYVIPLIALVGGVALLDEKIQIGIIAGGLLILVGVVLANKAEPAVTVDQFTAHRG